MLDSTKLPLRVWFLAMYLLGQAKTGLSALALKRHLGVSYRTAWLVHHKVMGVMAVVMIVGLLADLIFFSPIESWLRRSRGLER